MGKQRFGEISSFRATQLVSSKAMFRSFWFQSKSVIPSSGKELGPVVGLPFWTGDARTAFLEEVTSDLGPWRMGRIWQAVCLVGSDSKESARSAGDLGLIPGSRRSPEEGNGNPLQYSCLENSMDRGAWWVTVHGVAKCQTQLSD